VGEGRGKETGRKEGEDPDKKEGAISKGREI